VDGVKERPILFSAPMVRAILEGRKTQTRRKVFNKRTTNYHSIEERDDGTLWPWRETEDAQDHWYPCPYGQPGDLIWVRETCRADELPSGLDGVRYLADDAFVSIENTEQAAERWGELACYGMKNSGRAECRLVPSIHMPRWASRISLEITGVRVERLQDISEADALAEGVYDGRACQCEIPLDFVRSCGNCGGRLVDSVGLYRKLWESINGPGSWEANPWVWVIEFKRVKGGAA